MYIHSVYPNYIDYICKYYATTTKEPTVLSRSRALGVHRQCTGLQLLLLRLCLNRCRFPFRRRKPALLDVLEGRLEQQRQHRRRQHNEEPLVHVRHLRHKLKLAGKAAPAHIVEEHRELRQIDAVRQARGDEEAAPRHEVADATAVAQVRGEDDPGEQAAPAHRSEGRIDGGVLGIVAICDAAHRRRAEEGGEEQ